jgi:hypothetical protein
MLRVVAERREGEIKSMGIRSTSLWGCLLASWQQPPSGEGNGDGEPEVHLLGK